MFGYLPLGMAFGVLFVTQLEYPWWGATLMSITVFAGAAQLLAVGLLAANAGLVEVFIAMFVLNARHLFYGLSLLGRFRGAGWRKLYLIFGLTDETYSLLTSRARTEERAQEQQNDFRITLFNQAYWVIGSTLGAWLGRAVTFDSTGIEFALVALFIVLTIEQYKVLGQSLPIWIGAAAAGLCLAVLPADQQLIGAVILATVTLLLSYRFHKRGNAELEQPHG
ncbi:AzlC family ABC transporter permease [Marinobacter fonticola]|uniref:AzlC family ABC transporter permease n=1 Tax=Marinobacter fonticola TaxID=2603215 RepID=UPI0011E71138|nr:AzlC family ABC transporter permease [Marinobacter fonticola]